MSEVLIYVRDNWQEILIYALDLIVYILIVLYGRRITAKASLLKGLVQDNQELTLKQITDLQIKNDNSLVEAKAYYEKAIKVAQKCEDMLHRIEQFTKFLCKEVYTDAGSDTSDNRNDQEQSEDS